MWGASASLIDSSTVSREPPSAEVRASGQPAAARHCFAAPVSGNPKVVRAGKA